MLNYTSHKNTKGLGDFGAGPVQRGLIIHSTLAVTTKGIALGLLDQFIWTRDPEDRGKRIEKRQKPIKEKESYKWLKSMDRSQIGVPNEIRLVHVGDREADVYEFFDYAIANEQDFLVRVVQNRVTTDDCKLFDKVKQLLAAGNIVVEIPRDTRRNLPKREATLEIRYSRVNIKAPVNTPKKFVKHGTVTLSIVHVHEINPPEGIEPIEWYLVTSFNIANLDEAVEKVSWYIHRWKIERFHYILKSGCEIEKKQNRTAERLQKLILVYSILSVRILGMTYMARQNPEAPCTIFLEEEEWKVLYCIATRTSTPPKTAPTIKEAVSYLAKLGGFLGRKGDGEPGAQVIWKGLNELNTVLKHLRYLYP
ncbi:IS4 family transposase [Fodinisporobacter ferrooxydans]|uniref:IS4 family transposase n=2 Tax=Fodinisporobacter ferrooxydans TaxID=2901836 RepID=A0ABY4CKW7_9BACL|nr:IS4 family transposase [Alicyclobacillaceae bacterium MYW30-H2]